MQTKKCVGANEFELLFEEVFNLLRPTLYPREWNFWTISEMEEEVMILCRGSRMLWVGSEAFRWRFWQPSKDWHKWRDDDVFRVWGDGHLRAGGKCCPVLLTLFFYVRSFLSLFFLSCSSCMCGCCFLAPHLVFFSFFLSHNSDRFNVLLKYHFDTVFPPFEC